MSDRESYLFDNAWQQERQRLGAIEQTYDPGTIRALEATGVKRGWKCLEIGSGGGSIAEWLSKRVGRSGNVVATDIDTRFVETIDRPNLQVWTHNIITDELPQDAFDLIHMRLLLDMVPDRDAVLEKLVGALKPDGWLVIEEFDLEHQLPDPGVGADAESLFRRTQRNFQHYLEFNGANPAIGRELMRLFYQHGLENIATEGRAFMRRGGSPGSVAWRLSLEQSSPALIDAGLLTEDEVQESILQLNDPNFFYLSPLMIATRGQKFSSTDLASARSLLEQIKTLLPLRR